MCYFIGSGVVLRMEWARGAEAIPARFCGLLRLDLRHHFATFHTECRSELPTSAASSTSSIHTTVYRSYDRGFSNLAWCLTAIAMPCFD